MIIDTHSHVNFNAFKEDSLEVLKNTLRNNTWVVMPGSQLTTSERAIRLAEQFPEGVYAAVGLHPIHLEERKIDVQEVQSENVTEKKWMTFETRGEVFEYEKYKALAQSKKVVAIGEVGLDYYYEPKGKARKEAYRARQKETLIQQINLTLELSLPVIFHCRVAHDDLLSLLKERYKGTHLKGVLHSYTGTVEQAQKFLALGLYFGFNGLIFKNIAALPNPEEVISSIPLDRIVLETDSPYLVPPQAKVERNEPLFVQYVAEEVARIKKANLQDISDTTTASARTLFCLR